jgi:hypothetical protein
MKKLFVKKNEEISLKDFRSFIDQYAKGDSLDSLSLCNEINSKWRLFVCGEDFPDQIELSIFDGKSLPKGHPPSQPGVYGIFARCTSTDYPFCFYVGISTTDIRSRLRTHLGKDIIRNYRSIFKCIERYDDIFICSSTLPDLEKKNTNRQKLELLEHCLTVLLRPRFLILAAEANSVISFCR